MFVSDVFQLLSDPSRRHLLEALRDGERSVNDLVDKTQMSQPAVSKQLRHLKDSGMVILRIDGRQRLSLDPWGTVPGGHEMVGLLRAVLAGWPRPNGHDPRV